MFEQKLPEEDQIQEQRQPNFGGGFRKRKGDKLNDQDIMDMRQRRGKNFRKRKDDEEQTEDKES